MRSMYEGPEFEVVQREGSEGEYEIRQYKKHLVAEVEFDPDTADGDGAGFRILAGFIFGKNHAADDPTRVEKVSMTTPVQLESAGKTRKMRFFMPKKYTLDTLPRPTGEHGDRIKVYELESETMAVLTYSGDRIAQLPAMEAKLRGQLERDGVSVLDLPVVSMGYDPPITPGFLKRNEVAVRVNL